MGKINLGMLLTSGMTCIYIKQLTCRAPLEINNLTLTSAPGPQHGSWTADTNGAKLASLVSLFTYQGQKQVRNRASELLWVLLRGNAPVGVCYRSGRSLSLTLNTRLRRSCAEAAQRLRPAAKQHAPLPLSSPENAPAQVRILSDAQVVGRKTLWHIFLKWRTQ